MRSTAPVISSPSSRTSPIINDNDVVVFKSAVARGPSALGFFRWDRDRPDDDRLSALVRTGDTAPLGGTQTWTFSQLIDLSVGIIPGAAHEPWKPSAHYLTHEGEGLDFMKNTFGVSEDDLVWSNGQGLSTGRPIRIVSTLASRALAVTVAPGHSRSAAVRAVMILAVLAGCTGVWMLSPISTRPVPASPHP